MSTELEERWNSARPSARWQHLVTPRWLAETLSGAPVVAAPAREWRLFEVGHGGLDTFFNAHVPGAGYLNTASFERGSVWNKVPDDELLALLLAHGIRHDTTVILYGRNTLCAARAAHLMLYAGVKDVRLLDGGQRAWRAAGYPMARGAPVRWPAAMDFGVRVPAHPEYLIDTPQARKLISERQGVLVSVRTWDEYSGKTSGYPYITARGDIPGARWGRAGKNGDVNSMSDFHRPDGTMKPADEIRALWRQSGIHAGQRTAFYCGTGWRASLAFFYAWLMNWEHISVYDGGWCEWSRDPDNPIRVGAAPHCWA